MKINLLIPVLAAALLAQPLAAQTPEDEVLEVVTGLFDAMRAGDTTAMRSTFHPAVRLITTGTRNGEPFAALVPVDAWLGGVAGAEQVLDERLYDTEVRVRDNLATVWTGYDLYVGDRFSHCGADAFQLVRTADGWKITQVADTRQQQGCEPQEETSR